MPFRAQGGRIEEEEEEEEDLWRGSEFAPGGGARGAAGGEGGGSLNPRPKKKVRQVVSLTTLGFHQIYHRPLLPLCM